MRTARTGCSTRSGSTPPATKVERRHLTLNAIGDKVTEEDQSCGAPGPACLSWTTKRSESFAYDVHNRLAGVLHPVPAGSRTFNAYDPDGLLATVQDEGHASPNTLYAYDALHRLTGVRQTLAGAPGGAAVTGYTYDVMDNLASVTDPNGNLTRYTYDDFKRLVRQDSPVTGITTYQYDPAGNLVSTTDARGAVAAKTYDASNRLLASTSQLAGSATETVTYAYDSAAPGSFGKGRLAQMTDPSGPTSYAYERRGLLKSEQRSLLGTNYTTGYQYDANGNRSGLTYPSGRQVTYGFDFADRPASAASPTTVYVASAAYLPFGPETRLALGNGTVKTMTYDLRYRPLENRLDGSSSTIADYLYQEDAVGNITEIHDALDAGFNRDFGYDDLYRLTSATTGDSLWGAGTYGYDPMGNMTALSLGSSRSAAFAYQGTLPKLATVVEDGITRAVSYDPAGNEQAVGSGAMTYSARNLLAAADGLAYTYDGRGIRVALAVAAAPGTITGSVVDAGGAGIAGATVRITGSTVSTTTDGSGGFSLSAPAGTYTVAASEAGYLSATSLPFALPAGGTFSIGILRLAAAPGRITGTVLSSLHGEPLAGATVSLAESADTAFTGTDGSFVLAEPAGTWTVSIAQPGYATQTLPPISLPPGKTGSLGTVTLIANPATVTGRIVTSVGGAGIAGATVQASGTLALTTFTATTDATGAFTLTLPPGTWTFTISKAGFGSRTTSPASLGPGASLALGTLPLDPLGTVTGTVVQAGSGAPVAGAIVQVVGTLNQVATDAAGGFVLTQGAGTYRLKVSAAGLADLTTAPFSLAAGGAYDAGTLPLSPVALSVFVGYADNLRASSAFPVPWQGSPNVVFLGNGPVFDAGAVRLDNATDAPIAVDGVSVDIGRPGPVYNLWGSFTVPAHGSVILTQTAAFNFDTSDFPIVGCNQTLAPNDPRVPQVKVTVGGVGTTYFDTGHILDTGGYDLACRANESLQWRLIGTTGINSNGAFLLAPVTGTSALGSSYALTAVLTDANNQPLPNVTVVFTATAGPNKGRTGQAVTDASGRATFAYASTFSGTDTWQATITNQSGGTLTSNAATVVWPPLAGVPVFVGYADSLRPDPSFPVPWQGAPNVIFRGGGPTFDAGAIRLDNTTDNPIVVDKVVVDLQRPGPTFNLWGSFTIPAHGSAILTQSGEYDFDTSDFPIVGCGGTVSPSDPRIPKITVTIGGFSASYLDTAHILDTFGYDLVCLNGGNGNESLQWRPVGSDSTTTSGQIALRPELATLPVGALYKALGVATDAANEPLANATVHFSVLSGPNAGRTGQAVTDDAGIAAFTYASTATGTDTVQATITNSSGGTIPSNRVNAVWVPTAQIALTPATATQAVGTPYNATALVTDGAGHPLVNATVTFRVTAGPNAGKTGTGTTDSSGQAIFSYTSTTPGTDTLDAEIALAAGGVLASNQVTAAWTAPWTLTLAPAAQTQPIHGTATLTATLEDGARQPVPGVAVTLQVTSGPNAGASAQATTGAAGTATFTLSSNSIGTDVLQGSIAQGPTTVLSNAATATWIAIPTTLTYLGAPFGEYNDPLRLAARLTDAATGNPLAGQVVSFDFGGQTASATTDANGVATVTVTPAATPGTVALSISFAGSGPYTGSVTSVLLGIHRDDTAIVYTGKPALANGLPQTVSARLTDAEDHAPLAGKTVTFTVGSIVVSAVTDAAGNATAALTLPATLPTGATSILVAFAGDAYELPASTRAPLVLYQASSFVIWGGNTGGLALGQRVNFWGSQWESQVTAGDYAANASFKGYGTVPSSPIGICEPMATTTGTPRLDQACWTSKPGDSSPPATVADYIQVIVATSIAKSGSTIYGNIASTVVVQVDRSSPYGPDPGHPGFGTIVAVIDDGAGLFPAAAALRIAITASADPGKPSAKALSPAAAALATGSKRNSLYSPEMHLLAESELTTNLHPLILNEYVWFNGKPIAQADSADVTSWTFTDHLGTPILQTSAPQGIVWRAEYEPYGAVFGLRTYDRHQPLRLPGQEAEQLSLGANGVTERSYNIHRWYEAGRGGYAEADQAANLLGRPPRPRPKNRSFRFPWRGGLPQPYAYANDNPSLFTDRLGLAPERPVPRWQADPPIPTWNVPPPQPPPGDPLFCVDCNWEDLWEIIGGESNNSFPCIRVLVGFRYEGQGPHLWQDLVDCGPAALNNVNKFLESCHRVPSLPCGQCPCPSRDLGTPANVCG
ncbi:MAG TPA: carboxypeptidase regulatory-like domain-containing protein [Thermoanaerobaculia bacterium]|nr:carboxypeptidase regulatory-like domain-containing protein [Thermoanaerobaculia bacterium]